MQQSASDLIIVQSGDLILAKTDSPVCSNQYVNLYLFDPGFPFQNAPLVFHLQS
ncbi:hypothetical protein [Spirosoma panaciterrae]|uniref:hypothetical protein n=1 Tax=Spirosoma panaciterrae TaxID=496058 RepID=UPI001B7FB15C|nr:hypothetical protein [Spirosoma panaciterrae]